MAISSRKIEDLHEEVQWRAEGLIALCADEGFTIKVISSYRDVAAQNELYAQGRTKPGAIVTNARGGYSNHQYRRAFDIGVFKFNEEKDRWDYDGNDWRKYNRAGALGKELGLTWAGDWKSFKELAHFEYMEGYTTADFREGRVAW